MVELADAKVVFDAGADRRPELARELHRRPSRRRATVAGHHPRKISAAVLRAMENARRKLRSVRIRWSRMRRRRCPEKASPTFPRSALPDMASLRRKMSETSRYRCPTSDIA